MFADLATDRLVLRELRRADAARMYEYRRDPQVARFQSWEPESIEALERFIARLAGMRPDTPGEWYQVGVTLRDTGELIGDCGIHALEDPRTAEIGITIAPGYQRRGYAREALRAVLGYLFLGLRMHRVCASVDPRNSASMRLMQGLGFRQEGRLVESLWLKGEWVDDAIFAMLEREWEPPITGSHISRGPAPHRRILPG